MARLIVRRCPTLPAVVGGGLVTIGLAGSFAFWPGLMIWDSARQYEQAVSGAFDDWHPPMMEAIWRLLLPLSDGPAPMLVLQLALYGGGFALLVGGALRRGEAARAALIAACALNPLTMALMGEVIKDSLMAGVLVLAVGLWAGAKAPAPWRRVGAAALILFAASLRYNGFLAGLPLLVALLPASWLRTPARLAGVALAGLVALMAVTPLANAALGAKKSGVELSLVIFDLAGIGAHSGKDVFPPTGVADPVAVNRSCYDARRWDRYAEWSDDRCPIHFDAVRAAFERQGVSPRLWQARAILAHPIAWSEHRLAHWNLETGFLVRGMPGRAIPARSDPNDADSQITQGWPVRWVDRLARYSALTPLGWPCCWLALALGLAILSPALPSRGPILPLALSGLIYGLGYAVFGVATDERYYLWTTIATGLAAALTASERIDWFAVDRRRLAGAAAPVLIVAALAVAARLA